MVKTEKNYRFIPKLEWVEDKKRKIYTSTNGKFTIEVTFRKEYILKSVLRGEVGRYNTLEEAKNQAEFVV